MTFHQMKIGKHECSNYVADDFKKLFMMRGVLNFKREGHSFALYLIYYYHYFAFFSLHILKICEKKEMKISGMRD